MKFKILYIALFISSICFGQKINSEEILIKKDSIELPGILTCSKEKMPLIICEYDSRNIDQKSTIAANYIKQFKDGVNKHNVAFFSYNKRSVAQRNFTFLKNMIHGLKIVNSPAENQQSYFSEKFPLAPKLVFAVLNFIKK